MQSYVKKLSDNSSALQQQQDPSSDLPLTSLDNLFTGSFHTGLNQYIADMRKYTLAARKASKSAHSKIEKYEHTVNKFEDHLSKLDKGASTCTDATDLIIVAMLASHIVYDCLSSSCFDCKLWLIDIVGFTSDINFSLQIQWRPSKDTKNFVPCQENSKT